MKHDYDLGTLHHGDCLEVLRGFSKDSVDSVVTDPPAGIAFMGKEWDDFRRSRNENDAGRENVFGRTSKTGPEYGRGERDIFVGWLTEVMRECLRVLKPGGHALVWSIPRTSHWTGTALEEAGFEIRDSILHLFGQGFPKSLNVGKAIDKAKGVERTDVIGIKPGHEGFANRGNLSSVQSLRDGTLGQDGGFSRPWMDDPEKVERYHHQLAPATPEAEQWEGWGTSLKPAVEIWWLVRKPLREKTVAEQVLKTGTGGINIDASRIDTQDNLNGGAYSEKGRAASLPGDAREGASLGLYEAGQSAGEYQQPKGRWPANVVLTHSPECKKSIEDWACAPGCPVGSLNDQSGITTSQGGSTSGGSAFGQNTGWNGHANRPTEILRQTDLGGASRFFHNFEPDYDVPFFYTGKITSGERKEDLEEEGLINKHPTVKTQKLMTFLVKLITPPGGTVLDPFSGSGSTLVAAVNNGFRFTGIERDPDYFKIAKGRLDKAVHREVVSQEQSDLFDELMGS